jgi:hypothetical protein
MPAKLQAALRLAPHGPTPKEHLAVVVYGDVGTLIRHVPVFRLYPERGVAPSRAERRPQFEPTSLGPMPILEPVDEAYAVAWMLHARSYLAHRARLVDSLPALMRIANTPGGVRHLVGVICVRDGQDTTHNSTIAFRKIALKLVRPQPELTARMETPPKGADSFQVLIWGAGYKSLHELKVKVPAHVVPATGPDDLYDGEMGGWA